jgi:hypothetical protein
MFRIRIFLSESNWNDTVVPGENRWKAEALAKGMSPIGRAQFLGDA